MLFAVWLGFGMYSFVLFLASGIGEALGVTLGHLTLLAIKMACGTLPMDKCRAAMIHVVFISLGHLCSGFMWQPMVNFWQMTMMFPFTPAMICIGLMTGLFFLAGLTAARVLFRLLKLTDGSGGRALGDPEDATVLTWLAPDALLSLSMAGSEAFFVATMPFMDSSNWASAFAVMVTDTSMMMDGMCALCSGNMVLMAAFKAGATTLIGFFVVQTLLDIVLPRDVVWTHMT